MKNQSFLSYLCPVALVLSLLPCTLLAQQPSPAELSTPAVRVTTRLVLVDAVVADKSGSRIKDLAGADFTVLENGKPQKLALFSFEARGFERNTPRPTALPANIYTNRPEYSAPNGPMTVILLDALNTPIDNQQFMRAQLLRYLATQVQPDQRIAVYALGIGLRLIQDFTDDPALLRAAVERFSPEKSPLIQVEEVARDYPKITVLPDPGIRGQGADARILVTRLSAFYQEQVKAALEARAEATMAAMRILSRRLSGYPGRKNVVWVSAGFPLTITSQVVQLTTDSAALQMGATQNAVQERVEKSWEDDLRQLAAQLTDAQVSVYPVDSRGLLGSLSPDATRQGTNAAGLLTVGAEYGSQLARASSHLQDTQTSMMTLAEGTGGLIFKNRNDIDRAVATSVSDGSSYYLLGYYPEEKRWDGKFRRVQVKIGRPGLEVRHRQGYYAWDPVDWSKRLNEKVRNLELMTAMAAGAPPATMVVFDARVVPPAAVSGKTTLPVDVLVNPQTLLPETLKDGTVRYDAEFRVVAYTPEGKAAAQAAFRTGGPLNAERAAAVRQQGLPFHADLELPPGEYRLRIGIRDSRSGYIGATEFPITLEKSGG